MININTLQNAFKKLPRVMTRDQVWEIQIPERAQELNKFIANKDYGPNYSFTTLRFRVVQYCRSPSDCWLEWELDI